MSILIEIPSALHKYAGNLDEIEIEGATVGEVFQKLCAQYSDLKQHLYEDEGKVRSFINVYLNDEDIRFLENLDTSTSSGDEISIVPAIAGG